MQSRQLTPSLWKQTSVVWISLGLFYIFSYLWSCFHSSLYFPCHHIWLFYNINIKPAMWTESYLLPRNPLSSWSNGVASCFYSVDVCNSYISVVPHNTRLSFSVSLTWLGLLIKGGCEFLFRACSCLLNHSWICSEYLFLVIQYNLVESHVWSH